MQAGCELNVKVAEALGWQVYGLDQYVKDGRTVELPKFSTTWEGMGLLVEEAEKQGFAFSISSARFGYRAGVQWKWSSVSETTEQAPHAVYLAFLKAKGNAI
ncbi:hypothetical protein [Brevibacillus choshinensis]|uniref:hypothetical protein n=1 Tax=Brevibacillus choshinensis TaxID=54911 RepID=UPI002E202995|nr:hypothetical protein [Brevibacillus choshinensis]